MNGKQRITCIICPLGCEIEVGQGPEGPIAAGFECKRGEKYALQEASDPRRVLTGTIVVTGGTLSRLPVKTTAPIPKHLIPAAAGLLAEITAAAPIRCGDLIVVNFAGSGADLVSTRDLEAG